MYDETYNQLFHHWSEAHRVAMRRLGNTLDAEHLVFDTMEKMAAKPPWSDPSDPNLVKALLSQVRNAAHDFRRGRKRRTHNETYGLHAHGSLLAQPPTPLQVVARREVCATAVLLVNQLPASQRQTMVEVAFEGKSPADVALRTGRNTGTVRSDVFRAKASLRDAFERRFPERSGRGALIPPLSWVTSASSNRTPLLSSTFASKLTLAAAAIVLLLAPIAALLFQWPRERSIDGSSSFSGATQATTASVASSSAPTNAPTHPSARVTAASITVPERAPVSALHALDVAPHGIRVLMPFETFSSSAFAPTGHGLRGLAKATEEHLLLYVHSYDDHDIALLSKAGELLRRSARVDYGSSLIIDKQALFLIGPRGMLYRLSRDTLSETARVQVPDTAEWLVNAGTIAWNRLHVASSLRKSVLMFDPVSLTLHGEWRVASGHRVDVLTGYGNSLFAASNVGPHSLVERVEMQAEELPPTPTMSGIELPASVADMVARPDGLYILLDAQGLLLRYCASNSREQARGWQPTGCWVLTRRDGLHSSPSRMIFLSNSRLAVAWPNPQTHVATYELGS